MRITHDPGVDLYPRWSGTGSEIAFMSNRDSGTESMDLYVIDLDTQAVRRLTTTGGVFGHEWSPDDSTLVYAHETSTGLTIRTIGADGTDDRFVAEGSWPSFSPDGSQILFTQGEFFEEPQSLAIVDIDTGTVTAVPLALDNASESTWSPAGIDRVHVQPERLRRSGRRLGRRDLRRGTRRHQRRSGEQQARQRPLAAQLVSRRALPDLAGR